MTESHLFVCSASFNNRLRMNEIIVRNTVIKYTVILTPLFKDNQLRISLPPIFILIFNQDTIEKRHNNAKIGRKQL